MLPIIIGLEGLTLTSADRQRIEQHQPAGYILFSRNIENAEQVRALTDELRTLTPHLPFIGIDNEGGRVWRTAGLGPTPPNAAAFAKFGDFRKSGHFGAIAGRHLEQLGINLNFAPVLDLDHNPEDQNALRGRCWGHDSQDVIDHAGNFNRWHRRNEILTCGKHFPAGGVEATIEELLASDLIPYTALAPELDAIMIAHIIYPLIDKESPSSLSQRVVTGLLRDQLDYRGLILTDDLDMGAITKRYGRGPDFQLAWEAGNDLPLLCHELDSISIVAESYKKVSSGRREETEKRVEKALNKLPFPSAFLRKKFDTENEELAKLTEEISGSRSFQSEDSPQSPVEDY